MNRINYILFLLIFIIQQSLAGSLEDIDDINKSKLIPTKQKDVTQEIQNITSANMLRMQAFLKESKTRLKLALPLLIAGIAELYVSVSFNNNVTDKLKSCSEQESNANNILSCEHARFMNNNYNKNEINVILDFLPLYLLIDIVLSSSFIVNKTLYDYLSKPIVFVSDMFFNLLGYLSLFGRSHAASGYVPLSDFISLYAIISCFSNLHYRNVEREIADKKIEEFQVNINNSSVQAPIGCICNKVIKKNSTL